MAHVHFVEGVKEKFPYLYITKLKRENWVNWKDKGKEGMKGKKSGKKIFGLTPSANPSIVFS